MAEVEIDLPAGDPEEVEIITRQTERRIRWKLRDISLDPESRAVTVRFYSTFGSEVIHRTRTLSVETDPESGLESGFWLDNMQELNACVKKVLVADGLRSRRPLP
jgi:hypothetical protein